MATCALSGARALLNIPLFDVTTMSSSSVAVEECPVDGFVVDDIFCILTYGGSTSDVFINYVLLVLNLAVCTCFLRRDQSRRRIYLRNTYDRDSNFDDASDFWHFYGLHIAAFIMVVAFQLVLCLVLGCTGISIIWCALAGWIVHQKITWRYKIIQEPLQSITKQDHPRQQQSCGEEISDHTFLVSSDSRQASFIKHKTTMHVLEYVTHLSNAAAIIFYAIVADLLTTVAHFCALLLGVMLSKSITTAFHFLRDAI